MSANQEISIETLKQLIDKVTKMKPYRVPGDHDTFNSYNQGWGDSLDVLETEVEELMRASGETGRRTKAL